MERLSGFAIIDRIEMTIAGIIHVKLEKRFNRILSIKKFTYTYNTGKEIGGDNPCLESKIRMEVYRAYSSRSWERF